MSDEETKQKMKEYENKRMTNYQIDVFDSEKYKIEMERNRALKSSISLKYIIFCISR